MSEVKTEGLEVVVGTPSSKWLAAGEQDPHGDRYSCERAALAMGGLTDDELANGAFMNYDQPLNLAGIMAGTHSSPIAWMTAVKDRIRWLSRINSEALAGYAARDARIAELEAVVNQRNCELTSANRVMCAMVLDIVAVGEALSIPAEYQDGGTAEFVEVINQLRAELAALREQVPVQVDYVAVMRDDGDGGIEPEWLMEGGTEELMDGMYLCCIDSGALLFEEGSGQLYAAPAPAVVTSPHFCGGTMSKNPHPDAGVPEHVCTVGTVYECIPCLVKSRHDWSVRANDFESRLRDLLAAPAVVMPDKQAVLSKAVGLASRIPGANDWCVAEFVYEEIAARLNPVQGAEPIKSLSEICAEIEAAHQAAEVQRVIGRLSSSDPDFDDCADAVALLLSLQAEKIGPQGYATWQDAALAERLARVSMRPSAAVVAIAREGLEVYSGPNMNEHKVCAELVRIADIPSNKEGE
jgi:hypothetical protein